MAKSHFLLVLSITVPFNTDDHLLFICLPSVITFSGVYLCVCSPSPFLIFTCWCSPGSVPGSLLIPQSSWGVSSILTAFTTNTLAHVSHLLLQLDSQAQIVNCELTLHVDACIVTSFKLSVYAPHPSSCSFYGTITCPSFGQKPGSYPNFPLSSQHLVSD